MNKWSRRASALATSLAIGCATQSLQMPWPGGQDSWNYQEAIEAGGRGSNSNYYAFKVPGKGQTVGDYRDLFTHEDFRTNSPLHHLELNAKFMNTQKAIVQQQCPDVVWTVLQQDEELLLYESSISDCPAHEDQHEVVRIVTGNRDTWRITLTSKGKEFPSSKRDAWVNALLGARVVTK